MSPMQKEDVASEFADITELKKDYKYFPSTEIKSGIENFVNWFMDYNKDK